MHVPGFGPAAEVLLFRQKAPKPLTPPVLIKLDGRNAQEGGPTRQAQTRLAA